MRMISRILGMLGVSFFCASGIWGQQSVQLYGKKIAVATNLLRRKGDSVYVDLRIDMAALNVQSKRSLILTPLIRSSEGKQILLPGIVVKGKNQYKVYKREMSLMDEHKRSEKSAFIYAVLNSKEPRWNFRYQQVIPFENWMLGAVLEIEEELCGCGKFEQKIDIEYIATIPSIPVYRIKPHIAYVQSEIEAMPKGDLENNCHLLNAAAGELEKGALKEAENLLKRVKQQTAIYNNCMGVLRMLEGYYDMAERYLVKAASEGLEEASDNLNEITRKRENIKLLK